MKYLLFFYEHAGVPLYSCENYSLRFQEIYRIQLKLVCFELYHLYLGMEKLSRQFLDILFQLQKSKVYHEESY